MPNPEKPSSVCMYINEFRHKKKHNIKKICYNIKTYAIISKLTSLRQEVRHTIKKYAITS